MDASYYIIRKSITFHRNRQVPERTVPLSTPIVHSPGALSLCAYQAVAAAQVPGEVSDVSHVLRELLLVPAGRELHLALQRPELRPQRLLAPPPGEDSRPGSTPAPAAAALQPPARAPARDGPGRRSAAPPRGHVSATAAAQLGDAAPEAAASRIEVATLDVRLQLVQPDREATAAGAVVTLDAQFADEAAQRKHSVQLAGLQGLALQRAPAPPRRPGQQAAGAEDVPARRAQGLLQHLAAQLALEIRVYGFGEALQGKAHGLDEGKGMEGGVHYFRAPCLPQVPLGQRSR